MSMAINLNQGDIQHRFEYHPPLDEATKSRHEGIREGALELAQEWETLLPPGREAALAITKLEEATMWANAAIASHCNGDCPCHST